MSNIPRVVGLTSFPPRKEGMLSVVAGMLPQCDKLYLYLNGYTERPPELGDDPKLTVFLAGPGCEYTDLGSQGKFFTLGQEDCYYLSIDDDIFYPDDYVQFLVNGVDRYDGKAIIGLHGGVYRARPGGPIPAAGFAKDHRVLYAYDKNIPRDIAVHILGCGVMACRPQEIGLTFTACAGPVHSGDDEDMAIFAQKNQIPMVCIGHALNWVRPNPKIWILDPLHRRLNYLRTSDAKLKSWKSWRILPPPAPTKLPSTRTATSKGPSFDDVLLSEEDLTFCNKILSSDALAAIVMTRIKQQIPTSVIRMSDGELGIIRIAQGVKHHAPYLADPAWLRKYGLSGCDLRQLGNELLTVGKEADFLAATISGIFWDIFRVHTEFPERQQFIDQFYPAFWDNMSRTGAVLRAAKSVLVAVREATTTAVKLKAKYGLKEVSSYPLNAWQDHPRVLAAAAKAKADLVLVSGGASGKILTHRLAQELGCVALDVGSALTTEWTK